MPSPFLHGNPVPPSHFVGRRRELARILDRLTHHGQSTAVIGEPRTGKTSLLDYLASPEARDALRRGDREHILVSYIDSHALDRAFDDAAFWEHALEPLDDPNSPLPADSPVHAALQACREGGYQTRRIKSLLRALNVASVRIALLIDEFDYLVRHCVADPRAFFGGLRSITTLSRGALALVLASRRSLAFLDDVAQGAGYSGSPYFNFVAEEVLGPLERDEVDQILARAAGRFSSEDHHLIHELAAGHPYLVQLTADVLFRAYDDGEHDPAARRTAAAARALREASRVLADTWRQWSPSQRFLVAAAAASAHVAPPASLVDPSRFLGEIDSLCAQGFLVTDGASFAVKPGLLRAFCLGELRAKIRSLDLRSDWIEQGGPDLPLAESETQPWIDALRSAMTGAPTVPVTRLAPTRRLKVFFSYAHEDSRHRDRLDEHLAALKYEGAIETWHDQRIAAGADWRATLCGALQEADVIVLLVSAAFLASDFCVDVQMEGAIVRHNAGTAKVIPIPLRPVDWGSMPFAGLEPLPRSGGAITQWENQDQAWKEVADGIRQIVATFWSRAVTSA